MNTAMSSDRTLMAWTRTALSFYGFGFALYKILTEIQIAGKVVIRDNAPRNYGLALIAMGTVGMIMGTIEYWTTLVQLRRIQHVGFARASFIVALCMCLAGIFLLISIIVKMF
jgi:putative membrane protein